MIMIAGTAPFSCKVHLKSITQFPVFWETLKKSQTIYIYIYVKTYLRTVAHVQAASFSVIKGFLKLTTFFISTTRDIYTKLLTFSESSVNIKVTPRWAFFVILFTPAAINRQRLLHGNKVMQDF